MTDKPQPLEPLRFPLWGSRLIEASAGTGKTFTIALLYLRLMLAHLGEGGAEKSGRSPEQVLVVTFTEAATQELRSRIREMLALAARCFNNAPAPLDPAAPGFSVITEWRNEFLPEHWPDHAQTLQAAAQSMDAAAISTIHGWCYRMLREHAFQSRTLFQQGLEVNGPAQRQQAVRDYWRRFYDPLPVATMHRIAKEWATPSDLDKALRPLLPYASLSARRLDDTSGVVGETAPDPQTAFGAFDSSVQQRLAPFKEDWKRWVPELRALFAQADAQSAFDRRKFKKNNYDHWLDTIAGWAEDPTAASLALATGWTRLTPKGLAEVWHTKRAPEHPALAQIAALQSAISSLAKSPRAQLLRHALDWVAAACYGRRRERTALDFDDMLADFAQALRGESGQDLARAVREQFPVALIDEFQDTDPVQYEIVDRIYGVANNQPDTCLVMIGDPKQAIYSFRQADIYTYLLARADSEGRTYSLEKNFRSTPAMVDAVNTVFALAESRSGGKGAFHFRKDGRNPVPFFPVRSQPHRLALIAESAPVCPVTWVVHSSKEGISKDQYLNDMAAASASQIAQWLALADGLKMGLKDQRTAHWKPLAPHHIAVLVDSGRQASLVRKALARHGLRSVYLSDKELVYNTPQAEDVYRWLQACAQPQDEALVRAALATTGLGLSISTLYALTRNELDWEVCLSQFRGYRETWLRRGVLPMLRQILIDFGVIQRLLGLTEDARGQSGERILTDLLHLAELLQQASVRLDGPKALLRYFAQQRNEASGDDEVQRRRLETDDALIRIITIHKSKGLQYPVVMLPFASAARAVKPDDRPIKWHDEAGRLVVGWDNISTDSLAKADAERLAEDIRKLYVAFTRAEHLLWVGVAPIHNQGPRAIDDLLGLAGHPPEHFCEAIGHWAADLDGHAVCGLDDLFGLTSVPDVSRDPAPNRAARATVLRGGDVRVPTRVRHDGWAVSSYSGIKARSDHVADDAHAEAAALGATSPVDSPGADNLLEMGQEHFRPWDKAMGIAQGPAHRFPKGAEPGTFLHGLLEWAARQGFSAVVSSPEGFKEEVSRQCLAFGWAAWTDDVAKWMLNWMQTELPLGPSRVALCRGVQVKPELEFWMAASSVESATIDSIVALGCLHGMPRKPLAAQQITGMLKGFIDLVVVHEGRYFVVDYKSNWLGASDADYTADALAACVLENRYELQYALYLLALHRLLRTRIARYDYDQHVGGAAYLFLRGLHGPAQGLHFERPPRACIEALDQLFQGTGVGLV